MYYPFMDGESDLDLAIKIRVAIGKWQEAHPEDEDEDVCRKSAILVNRALGMPLPPEYDDEVAPTPVLQAVPDLPEPVEEREPPKWYESEGSILADRLRKILTGTYPQGMKVKQIVEELRRRKWTPRSNDVGNYIRTKLCKTPELYFRVSHGYYCLVEEVDQATEPEVVPEAAPKPEEAVPPSNRDEIIFKDLEQRFGSRSFTFPQVGRPFGMDEDDIWETLLNFVDEGRAKAFPDTAVRPKFFQLLPEVERVRVRVQV